MMCVFLRTLRVERNRTAYPEASRVAAHAGRANGSLTLAAPSLQVARSGWGAVGNDLAGSGKHRGR